MRASRIHVLGVVAVLASGGTAAASSPFTVVEPASYTLSFHQVVEGVPTPSQSIHLHNATAQVATGDARCCAEGFTMAGPTPISIGAGQDVTWNLTCLTTNPAGAQTYFDLDYCGADCNDVSGMLTISATCSPPVMRLSSRQLDFPSTIASVAQQQTLAITNLTAEPVTWPIAVGGAGYTLVGDSAISIAAGATASVTIAIRPAEVGDHPGTLYIGATGDPDYFAVPLTSTTSAPMVTADSVLAFGDTVIGGSASAMVQVHNRDTAASFLLTTVTSDEPSFSSPLLTAQTLAPGATLLVPVQFAPTAIGNHTGQLSIAIDGATAPIATIALSGQGIGPRVDGGCASAPGAGLGAGFGLLALLRRRRRPSSATS